jgi:formate dehydrogenase iron-sulfur subunit
MDIGRTRLHPTKRLLALAALGGLGVVLIAYRFAFGLGAATNLTDGYPWGFWIAIDVLVGIALAGGGFVLAGVVHLFGGRRFHPLARPAILTALLGYVLFISALTVDLGRPWNIWKALYSWNHASPMFEVAWCVMFYTTVLTLEFVPAVLERLRLERLHQWWYRLTPFAVMAMLTMFAFAMTDSVPWTLAVLAILGGWEAAMRAGFMPRDTQMPLLLIMAGVILSTLHQSSLGTLFLIMDKVHPLWYTPILPLEFFLSAVMVGPAMVIVEALLSARVRQREPELPLLGALGHAMPYLIGSYLVVRVFDLLFRGAVLHAVTLSLESGWWWLETGLLLTALVLFATPERAAERRGLLRAAALTVGALVVHRTGVALIGMNVPEYDAYVPAWQEVAITAGIASLGLLAFRLATEYLPIYEEEPEPDELAARATDRRRRRRLDAPNGRRAVA